MEIAKTVDGAQATMQVSGRLSVMTSPDLEEAVNAVEEEVKDLTLDLEEVEYVSSTGLRVFVAAQKMMDQRGGTFKLAHPSEAVMEVLEMTGLDTIFDIEE